MGSLHRLHPAHTSPTESDAVAAAEASKKACSSCLEPLSQTEIAPFHCDQCGYTVCQSCDRSKFHPVHPGHDLFYTTPTSPWKCNACKHDCENIAEIQCYHCEQCEFYVCKSCFAGVNSQFHRDHTLHRTDVRSIYSKYDGKWNCDVCHGNNGLGHFYPAHCSSCEFDLCDNCMKPYRSKHHDPRHVLYRADSKATYPQYNGVWFCDRCKRCYNPEHAPFHCSQCEFDLCESCMKDAEDVSNADTSDTRSPKYANMSKEGKPLAAPSDEANQQTGCSGPADENVLCPYCLKRPKNAQIVHGATAHGCCCVPCAEDYHAREAGCPVCRAPIDRIIRVFQ